MSMTRIEGGTPVVAPLWALLERRLLSEMSDAAERFVQRYTRPDGSFVWRDEWPGMDGSDDGYESFGNFPMFYALGGSEEVHRLARAQWEAVTLQFTGYGQVYREFDAYYDWMHHGESSLYIYGFGLADPTVTRDRTRMVRFANMYTGDDPEAPNYDPEKRLIRSPITGSRGPRFANSAVDWVTHRPILAHYPPPFEDIPGVPGPLCDWNDDVIFGEVLQRLNDRMMRGDVPLNLSSTSLVTCAYLYTGDERYRTWVLDYTDAWRERCRRNGGIMPDNVGPSDQIGECMDGKWWGGYYGWRWPHGMFTILEPCLIAAANCLLLTGDTEWLDLPRSQLDRLAELGEMREGRLHVPHRHGDNGWYDSRPLTPRFHMHLWYLSQAEEDWQRLLGLGPIDVWGQITGARGKGDQENSGAWMRFVRGECPEYPEAILRANEAEMLRRVAKQRDDDTDPETWDVHHWQEINPVGTEALIHLTLGGPQVIYHGGLLHCRLRYFDPQRRRAGLPDDVAALVEGVTEDRTFVRLVNLNPLDPREVILQAGAFAEHRFRCVKADGSAAPVDDAHLVVGLPPGAELRLELCCERYVNRPTFALPWHHG
ncbi:MAG: hypothetical protein HYU66_10310 [Armatimonadetes bacterium]|nr:hypothetical protein [Armatimonadota bacterium]